MDITFKHINLAADFIRCVEFRKDSFLCSFGNLQDFELSVKGYQSRIESRIELNSWFYFHIWLGFEIIGQLEFKSFSDEPNLGYIHLIYVTKKYRGKCVANLAENFIEKTLKEAGCSGAILSVSRTNLRALKHYEKFGWKYLKPNPKHELTDYYSRQFK